jgi:hypothetical protein
VDGISAILDPVSPSVRRSAGPPEQFCLAEFITEKVQLMQLFNQMRRLKANRRKALL